MDRRLTEQKLLITKLLNSDGLNHKSNTISAIRCIDWIVVSKFLDMTEDFIDINYLETAF